MVTLAQYLRNMFLETNAMERFWGFKNLPFFLTDIDLGSEQKDVVIRISGQAFDALPEDSRDCAICMAPFESCGEHGPIMLPCGHVFGLNCLEQWLDDDDHSSCPLCRRKYTRTKIMSFFPQLCRHPINIRILLENNEWFLFFENSPFALSPSDEARRNNRLERRFQQILIEWDQCTNMFGTEMVQSFRLRYAIPEYEFVLYLQESIQTAREIGQMFAELEIANRRDNLAWDLESRRELGARLEPLYILAEYYDV